MKILITLIFCLTTLSALAKDESAARHLFHDYLLAFGNKDLPNFYALMSREYLKKSGGEKHWKEIIKQFHNDYKGAEPGVVEFKVIQDKYYARFTIKFKSGDTTNLTENWYRLSLDGDRFVIDDFVSDFNPEE